MENVAARRGGVANIEQYIAELQQIAAEAADLATEFEASELAGQVESLLKRAG